MLKNPVMPLFQMRPFALILGGVLVLAGLLLLGLAPSDQALALHRQREQASLLTQVVHPKLEKRLEEAKQRLKAWLAQQQPMVDPPPSPWVSLHNSTASTLDQGGRLSIQGDQIAISDQGQVWLAQLDHSSLEAWLQLLPAGQTGQLVLLDQAQQLLAQSGPRLLLAQNYASPAASNPGLLVSRKKLSNGWTLVLAQPEGPPSTNLVGWSLLGLGALLSTWFWWFSSPSPLPVVLAQKEPLVPGWLLPPEALPTSLLLLDQKGNLLHSNPRAQALFGSPGPASLFELEPALTQATWQSRLEKAQSGLGWEEQVHLFTPQAKLQPFLAQVSLWQKEEPALVIATFRPLPALDRELALLRQDLHLAQQKTEELERFNDYVSHDLKTPLITIKGFLGLLEQDLEEGQVPRISRDLSAITQAADRMHQLLEALGRIARMSRTQPRWEEVDLGQVITLVLQEFHRATRQGKLSLEIRTPLPKLTGDKSRLVELFQHLLDNALKFYAGEGPCKVILWSEEHQDHWRCFVSDNGPGVEERHRDKVFHLFEKLDRSSKGAGLGLALARKIMEIHGGRIWIEAKEPEPGCLFVLEFPRNHEEAV